MPKRTWLRSGFVWAGLILVLLIGWFAYSDRNPDLPTADFNSTVIADIKAGKVDHLVTTEGSSTVEVHYKDSARPTTQSRLPPNTNVVEVLTGAGLEANAVPVEVKAASHVGAILSALVFRSEERRVGKECGYQCISRWSPYH